MRSQIIVAVPGQACHCFQDVIPFAVSGNRIHNFPCTLVKLIIGQLPVYEMPEQFRKLISSFAVNHGGRVLTVYTLHTETPRRNPSLSTIVGVMALVVRRKQQV